jgi:hypothetical protein
LASEFTIIGLEKLENQPSTRITPERFYAKPETWFEIAVWQEHGYASAFGNRLPLTQSQFRLLELLVSAQGLSVPHDILLSRIAGQSLSLHIAGLREALASTNTTVTASYTSGYRLEAKSPLLASIIAGNRFKQIEPPFILLDSGNAP